jgi:hypothetical protein
MRVKHESALRYIICCIGFHISEMAKKCRPIDINEPVGEDYTRIRSMIADLFALVQPLVDPPETRPSKRTRNGLSVEERGPEQPFSS